MVAKKGNKTIKVKNGKVVENKREETETDNLKIDDESSDNSSMKTESDNEEDNNEAGSENDDSFHDDHEATSDNEHEEEEEIASDVSGADGGECLYNFAKKKIEFDEENDDDEKFDDDDKQFDQIANMGKRITKPVMTHFEKVRVLGERTQQLSRGAKPMIKNVKNLSPKEIAQLELQHKVIPFIIIRTLPNGTKESWKLHELEIF